MAYQSKSNQKIKWDGKSKTCTCVSKQWTKPQWLSTTIIIPLSTSLIDDAKPIRYRITKRDDLEEDSDLVLTQIRAIDNDRFIKKLAKLTAKEMATVKKLFDEITV